MATSHTINFCAVQTRQTSILQNSERHYAFICYGVQSISVLGCNHIRGVVHFHLTALHKFSVLHIHIINRDSLCLACVGIRPYIRHILCHNSLLLMPLLPG